MSRRLAFQEQPHETIEKHGGSFLLYIMAKPLQYSYHEHVLWYHLYPKQKGSRAKIAKRCRMPETALKRYLVKGFFEPRQKTLLAKSWANEKRWQAARNPNETVDTLASKLNMTPGCLKRRLKKLGVDLDPPKKVYPPDATETEIFFWADTLRYNPELPVKQCLLQLNHPHGIFNTHFARVNIFMNKIKKDRKSIR